MCEQKNKHTGEWTNLITALGQHLVPKIFVIKLLPIWGRVKSLKWWDRCRGLWPVAFSGGRMETNMLGMLGPKHGSAWSGRVPVGKCRSPLKTRPPYVGFLVDLDRCILYRWMCTSILRDRPEKKQGVSSAAFHGHSRSLEMTRIDDLRTINVQRRKPWGDGGTRPPSIWSGGRQCIMSPQILTFYLYFSLT